MLRLATTLMAVGAVSAAAPAAAAAAPSCRKAGERVQLSKAQIAVTAKGGSAYLCWRPTGRRMRISGALSRFRIEGSKLGFARSLPASSQGMRVLVQSVDVRRRRYLMAADAWGDQIGDRGRADAVVTDLEMTPAGDLAWIARVPVGYEGASTLQVYVRRLTTKPAVPPPTPIEEGADIDPASLALSGDFVYWTRAAAARSVRISQVPRP